MTDLAKKKFQDFRGDTSVNELMDKFFKNSAEYIQKHYNLSISDSFVDMERSLVDRTNKYLINRVEDQVKRGPK